MGHEVFLTEKGGAPKNIGSEGGSSYFIIVGEEFHMQRLLLPQGETKAANLIHVASKILNLILINRKTQNAMQNAMQCAQLI